MTCYVMVISGLANATLLLKLMYRTSMNITRGGGMRAILGTLQRPEWCTLQKDVKSVLGHEYIAEHVGMLT